MDVLRRNTGTSSNTGKYTGKRPFWDTILRLILENFNLEHYRPPKGDAINSGT